MPGCILGSLRREIFSAQGELGTCAWWLVYPATSVQSVVTQKEGPPEIVSRHHHEDATDLPAL
jgi:hypothetical protein